MGFKSFDMGFDCLKDTNRYVLIIYGTVVVGSICLQCSVDYLLTSPVRKLKRFCLEWGMRKLRKVALQIPPNSPCRGNFKSFRKIEVAENSFKL